MLRRADTQNSQSAAHQRHNDRVDPNRAGSKYQHGIATGNVGSFDCVQRSRQRAPAAHKQFRLGIKTNTACAGLQVNLLGPTTAQSILQPVRNAIDLSLRTSGCRFGYEAVPTGIAGAVHIEKCDAIAFAKLLAFDVEQLSTNLTQTADRNVTGNEGVGNAFE